jgi:hypothetical protein
VIDRRKAPICVVLTLVLYAVTSYVAVVKNLTQIGQPEMKNFFEPNDPATKAFFVEMKADETIGMYSEWISHLQ